MKSYVNLMTPEFELYVQGKKVSMNEFVTDVIHDVVMALIQHLREVDLKEISKIEIS